MTKKLKCIHNSNVKLVLASKSPRRQALLKKLNLFFEVMVSEFDESKVEKSGRKPCEYAMSLASQKAMTVANLINEKIQNSKDDKVKKHEYVIIGADTIVVLNDKILGQPADEADARKMLKELSGVNNEVITGISIIKIKDGKMVQSSDYESTFVQFKNLSDYEIDRYIETGEPMDKAGAYGIQGVASLFVEKINGCYFNVVGLPLMKLSKLFEKNEYTLI